MDKNPKILIVDDNEINIDVIEAFLLQNNKEITVLKASDGQKALDIIRTGKPDLILLDVMMPGLDGYEVCRRLKALDHYNLPVIMITALEDRESLIKGLEAGADDFLTKPVDRNELMVRINNLLKVKRLTDNLNARYQELKTDLEMARRLQEGFLPQAIPDLKELEIQVFYRTSIGVGGDFYDFLVLNEQRLGVFIADVSGHGVSSAMITAVLKDLIAKGAKYWGNPRNFLAYLNEEMYAFFTSANSDHYVTAFYAVFDLTKEQVVYSNAGHPAPVYLGGEGTARLDCNSGFPLGLFAGGYFDNMKKCFLQGDQVFLFTDGIFGLANKEGKFLKDEVLVRELAENKGLFAYLQKNTGTTPGFSGNDDINIIKIHRRKTKESGG